MQTGLPITRIYTDASGESRFGETALPLALVQTAAHGEVLASAPLPLATLQVVESAADRSWHCAPRRQLVVVLQGAVEVEVAGGDKRLFGAGSMFLAEDTTGRGHVSRNAGEGARRYLFLALPEGEAGLASGP